jgi:hypothetical protein
MSSGAPLIKTAALVVTLVMAAVVSLTSLGALVLLISAVLVGVLRFGDHALLAVQQTQHRRF